MKSFVRYAVTIGLTGAVTTTIAFALFGLPSPATATAQPQPQPGSGVTSGTQTAVQPPTVASPDPGSGATTTPASPAGSGATAEAGSAAGSAAGAGSGAGSADAPPKPTIVPVDCKSVVESLIVRITPDGYDKQCNSAIAPPDKLAEKCTALEYIELGSVVKFVMTNGADVQPYPDDKTTGIKDLRARADQTTCLRFLETGRYRFRSQGKPIEGVIVIKTWYELLTDRPIDEAGNFWLPKAVNVEADSTDQMFIAVLALSFFFFFAILIAVVYLTWKYRHRPGHKAEPSPAHHDALEITWTVIPTIISVFLFYYGWRTYVKVVTPPAKAVEIQTLAWRWAWQFTHHNGVKDKDLHVPVNTAVRLVMTSKDVLHAFYAPVMRVKQDIIPRRYTYAWFFATKPGTYRLTCAEYCGTDHSQMGVNPDDGRRAVVVVHEPTKYEQYLADEQARSMNLPPKDLGAKVFANNCTNCHTADGSAKTGPTFKGAFGTMVPLAGGGKVKMDETYIRESVLNPTAKTHDGFPSGTMPSFEGQLKEKEIEGLIAFIKSLK